MWDFIYAEDDDLIYFISIEKKEEDEVEDE